MALPIDVYKQIFVEDSGLLSPNDFDKAVASAEKIKRPLEQVLMERAFLAPYQFLQLLASFFKMPAKDLRIADVDREALRILPEGMAEKYMAIPFAAHDDIIHVAFAAPTEATIQELQQIVNHTVKPFITTEHMVRRALVLYHGNIADVLNKMISKDTELASDTGVQGMVETIVETAILLDASDAHIEPFEDSLIIRMRVDGLLRQVAEMPIKLLGPLVTQLKIRAEAKIDEHRLPQDGRFALNVKGQEVNIRLSTVPSLWGEKVALRILPKEAHLFDIYNVGFLDVDLTKIKEYLKRPFGLILVCGPTGSGKTTTLYSFLQEIGSERIDVVNISTIEDPIEYTVPRVTQIQTRPEINLTFAAGLRAILRQDPDIIMVGEIRDTETADFAVRAALVGRLVLSSLHTNDAVGAIPRLLDMGVEPYLVSSTLALVVAQRLARKLCIHCRESYTPDQQLLEDLRTHHNFDEAFAALNNLGVVGSEQPTFYKAVGCEYCSKTGYSGRIAIYEILEMSDTLRKQVAERKDTTSIRKTAIAEGMKTMFADGLAKVFLGHIDVNELLRVVYS